MASGQAAQPAAAEILAGSTLTPNPTADYKGTTLKIKGAATLTADATSAWQARASINGNSTFLTWLIIYAAGTTIGSGSMSGVPIRQHHVSGILLGSGTIGCPPFPGVNFHAGSSLSATATVNRGVSESIHAGSSFSATDQVHLNAATAIFGSSILSPPGTAQAAILAGSHLGAFAPLSRSVQAHLVAGSSFSAQATVDRVAQVAIAGLAHLAAADGVNRGARATLAGGATVTPQATAHYAATAPIVANSYFPRQPPLPASVAIAGGSSFTAQATLHQNVSGEVCVVQTLILGGQVIGAGTLGDRLLVSLGGTLAGAGTLLGTPVHRIGAKPLPMVGRGGMHDSIPLPMVGYGTVAGFFEVVRVPPPLCPPRCPKEFRWGYILTRGDLELRVCDDSGNPFGPVVVLFSFYQIVRGGQRQLVGPPNRRPAIDKHEGKPGQYYATGTAGELGQPGLWVVVWRWQRSWWTPVQTFEEKFKVVDVVESREPGYLYGRCRKFGWL